MVVIGATGVFDMRRDGSGLVKLADVTGVKNIFSDDIVTDGVERRLHVHARRLHLLGDDDQRRGPVLPWPAGASASSVGVQSSRRALDADAIYWATSAALRRFER